LIGACVTGFVYCTARYVSALRVLREYAATSTTVLPPNTWR
jgi:hypothetical protein